MKKILLAFAFVPFALDAQVLLFDQGSNLATTSIISQNFDPTYDTYDCIAADDFDVPTGETWYIDSMLFPGTYFLNGGTGIPVDTSGLNIKIYADVAGAPGTIIWDSTFYNADTDGDGKLIANFSTPLQLNSGVYWIGVQAEKEFSNSGGQWAWLQNSTGYGADELWQMPGDGLVLGCTTWSVTSNCLNTTINNAAFQIFGCYGPVKPTVGNDTSFCMEPSDTVILSPGSPSALLYDWSNGETTEEIAIATGGHYIVTVTIPTTLCGMSRKFDVGVNPHSLFIYNDTICEGDSTSFLAYPGPGSYGYQWSNGTVNASTIEVKSEDWYLVTITNFENGCAGVDSFYLDVNENPVPEIKGSPVAHGCIGESVKLETKKNYAEYEWGNGEETETVNVTISGLYHLTVIDAMGCVGDTFITVLMHNNPVITISQSILPNGLTQLSATPGMDSYVWSTGETTQEITVTQDGDYSVTATTLFGCDGFAEKKNVTATAAIGIAEREQSNLNIYPNPTKGKLIFKATGDANYNIVVRDLIGRTVLEGTYPSNSELDLGHAAKGTYFITATDSKGLVKEFRIIKE